MIKKVGPFTVDDSLVNLSDKDLRNLQTFFDLPIVKELIEKERYNELLVNCETIFEENKLPSLEGNTEGTLDSILLQAGIDFTDDKSREPFEYLYLNHVSCITEINIEKHFRLVEIRKCQSLENVTIKEADRVQIQGCTFIEEITITNAVSILDKGAFEDLPILRVITLPRDFTWVRGFVQRCPHLSEIIYLGTREEWEKQYSSRDPYNIFDSSEPNEILISCTDGPIWLEYDN